MHRRTSACLDEMEIQEFRSTLQQNILRVGNYYFTDTVKFDYATCPLCGEERFFTPDGFGVVDAKLRVKKLKDTDFPSHQVIISPRTIHAIHTCCLETLDIWPSLDADDNSGTHCPLVAMYFDSMKPVLLVEVPTFITIFDSTLREMGHDLSVDDISIEAEFFPMNVKTEPLLLPAKTISVVGAFHSAQDEFDDDVGAYYSEMYAYHNRHLKDYPEKEVIKKIKLYPELISRQS